MVSLIDYRPAVEMAESIPALDVLDVLAEKFVDDMHPPNRGKSDNIRRDRVNSMKRMFTKFGARKIHINHLTSHIITMLKYRGWSLTETKAYITACGYTPVDALAEDCPGISIKEDDTGNVYTREGAYNPNW